MYLWAEFDGKWICSVCRLLLLHDHFMTTHFHFVNTTWTLHYHFMTTTWPLHDHYLNTSMNTWPLHEHLTTTSWPLQYLTTVQNYLFCWNFLNLSVYYTHERFESNFRCRKILYIYKYKYDYVYLINIFSQEDSNFLEMIFLVFLSYL